MNAREMIEALSKLDPETVVTLTEYSDFMGKYFEWSVEIVGTEIVHFDILKSWMDEDG